ncbi:hypothetical protein CWB96_12355 [Pseudoalteromonas citrea]|uniref:Uncharacterized protein n=1 Tax=Pseudoalteromonas citrea TaxID=43655 RepID=A0A5S3XN54_9GAMM|nr:hypothetical protein [Pseudoalteromonas citrea]TMP46388.1 hypothetical protein CWB97_01905 [Pseudoalteromonas citrea]TMP58155.1 hypothetical protein CWB96_12355 [Pseudoalteromonas citrea]
MSTIESQIQKLNDTNAELARVNNELTSAVRTHTNDINNEVAAAKNTMAAATASAISEVKADANAVNAEIKARMDDAVVPWLPAMTKVQFDALRADRKQQYAGSGFVEWGKHRNGWENINEGMSTEVTGSNRINLGSGLHANTNAIGQSSLKAPRVVMDGVNIELDSVGVNASVSYQANLVLLPPAPDGTKTYDSGTGTVTQHANAEVAFASETATNKVITSRKDLVFLESWHEKIADKDVVYPLGNVQYGASSYKGVTLLNNLVAQGYSAFGEWDENTKGFGAKWSSLTDAQKALFLSEPEHNIYYDAEAKIYVQVRYRIRVIEGLGDDWQEYRPTENNKYGLCYSYNNCWINSQNASEVPLDFTREFVNNVYWSPAGFNRDKLTSDGSVSVFESRFKVNDSGAFATPIALVQRMNQGAYHPTYNPMGCSCFRKTSGGSGVADVSGWYNQESGNKVVSSLECFSSLGNNEPGRGSHSGTGYINNNYSGRSDQYKFYDAIYAGQVEDLRLNANKLDVNKLREDAMRKAVSGALRGKGKVPFTIFNKGQCLSSEFTIYIHRVNSFASSLIGKNIYYNARNYMSALEDFAVFEGAPIAIKFIDAGDTDLASYAGGVKLNEWLYLNKFQVLNSKNHIACINPNTGNSNWFSSGSAPTISAEILMPTENETPEFNSLPWVDIIGHPERIATTFPDGVVGQWISQIPDAVMDRFNLNKKASSTSAIRTFTSDDGSSWISDTTTLDNTKNQNITIWSASQVALIQYESPSNFTEPSNNAVVVGDVGDVRFNSEYRVQRGNRLQHSLIGEIGKDSNVPYANFKLTDNLILDDGRLYGNENNGFGPLHNPIEAKASSGNEGNSGMKALSTITEKNGLYYLQLHGAELKHHKPTFTDVNPSSNTTYTEGNFYRLTNYGAKGYYVCEVTKTFVLYTNTDYIQMESGDVVYGPTNQVVLRKLNTADGSSWGDDQTIPIVNGEDVKTDLNGNTVKVFCHHTQIPLGIAHND